jgi:hypothetical protein
MLSIDFARLALGLVVAFFHRPIASFIVAREHALDSFFRSKGVNFPEPLNEGLAENLYFFMGIFICLFSMGHIWLSL